MRNLVMSATPTDGPDLGCEIELLQGKIYAVTGKELVDRNRYLMDMYFNILHSNKESLSTRTDDREKVLVYFAHKESSVVSADVMYSSKAVDTFDVDGVYVVYLETTTTIQGLLNTISNYQKQHNVCGVFIEEIQTYENTNVGSRLTHTFDSLFRHSIMDRVPMIVSLDHNNNPSTIINLNKQVERYFPMDDLIINTDWKIGS